METRANPRSDGDDEVNSRYASLPTLRRDAWRLQLGLQDLGCRTRRLRRRGPPFFPFDPLCDRFHQPLDLVARVARVKTHPDALLALRDRRVRDGSDEEAPLAEEGRQRAWCRREEGDDGRRGRMGRRRGYLGEVEQLLRQRDGGRRREDGGQAGDEKRGERVDVGGGLLGNIAFVGTYWATPEPRNAPARSRPPRAARATCARPARSSASSWSNRSAAAHN